MCIHKLVTCFFLCLIILFKLLSKMCPHLWLTDQFNSHSYFILSLQSKVENTLQKLGPRLFGATISAPTFSAPIFGAFWLTLTQNLTPTLNNWTVKEHRIGAETICAENVRQRNRWRRNGRTEKTWSRRNYSFWVSDKLNQFMVCKKTLLRRSNQCW